MNDKVTKISVNLENVDNATQKIQSLNKGLKDAEVNMQEVTKVFKDAPQAINDYIKTVDKLNKKGHLQGSVTSRDKQALDVRTSDINDILQEVINVKSATNLKTTDGKSLSDDVVKQLNDTANKLLSALSNAGISANIVSDNGRIQNVSANVGSNSALSTAYSQETRDYRNRDTSSVSQDMQGVSSSINELITKSNNLAKTLNSTITNNNRTLNNIEKTQQGEKVSYNRDRQYRNFFESQGNHVGDLTSNLGDKRNSLIIESQKLDISKQTYQKQLVTETDTAEIEKIDKKIQEISRLKEKVDLNINKLDAVISRGQENQMNIENTNMTYNEDTESGKLKVGLDPNSLKGRLQSQIFNITQRTLSQISSNVVSAESQGTQARTNAYNNGVSSIMFNEANNGKVSKKMDNDILHNFTELGLRNGTHYSGTEMAKFGGSYASTNRTGNISDYVAQTDAISQMARFSGMDSNSANQLVQSAGLSGVTSMIGLSQTLSGALQRSNMTARSSEQAQALASIYSNTANIGNMTSTEASRTATFQGMMASTKNSALQGQQGAQAYTTMANGLTDTNSNYAREMFAMSTGNPGKYSGRGGAARLSMDMEDARQDPTKLKGVLDTLSRTSGGDKDVMSQQLQEMAPNLSMHQAEGLVGLYQKGDFNKKKVDEVIKEDKEKGKDNKKGKEAYKGSGQNTIDFSIAVDEKGNVEVSKATDSVRGLKAHLKNNPFGVVVDAAINGLGAAAGGVLSGVISSRLRGDFKFSDILDNVKTYPEGKHSPTTGYSSGSHKMTKEELRESRKSGSKESRATRRSRTRKHGKAGGVISGIVDVGKNVVSGVVQDYAFDKVVSGVGKIGGKIKGLGKAAKRVKTAKKVSKAAKGVKMLKGVKGAGKLLTNPLGLLVGSAIGGFALFNHMAGDTAGGDITPEMKKRAKEQQEKNKGKGNKSSSKSKSSSKKGHEEKKKKFVDQEKELITRFDKMLDKAEKTIALAKSGGSSDSGDSSSDDSSSGKKDDKWYKEKHKPEEYKDAIKQAAKEMGQTVSDEQVNSIIEQIRHESGGDPNAKNGSGATGLLQYKPGTFKAYAVKGHTDIYNSYDQLLAFFNNKTWANSLPADHGSWGPTGGRIKNANGGFYSMATPRGNENIVGENGLEVAIPLGSDKYTRGKELLTTTAGLMGQAVVPQNTLSLLQTRANSSKTISPSYNLNVTVGNNTTPEETYNEVLNTLNSAQTQQNYENNLLNYYAQDVRGI